MSQSRAAIIEADIPVPGLAESTTFISASGLRSLWIYTQPAHPLTTGWTVRVWTRPARSSEWWPTDRYSVTVDTSPGDLAQQQRDGTSVKEIRIHAAEAYVQIVDITGDTKAVRLVIANGAALPAPINAAVGTVPPEEVILSHGSYSLSSGAAEPVTAAGTFVKLANSTTVAGSLNDWSASQNRLTYTGTETKAHQVIGTMSATFSSAAGTNLTFRFAVNGTTVPASHIGRYVGTSDQGALALLLPTQDFSNGDYVEVWADSDRDGDITPTGLAVSATETIDT